MEFSVSHERHLKRPSVEDHYPALAENIDHDLTKRKVSSEIDLHLGFHIKKIEETESDSEESNDNSSDAGDETESQENTDDSAEGEIEGQEEFNFVDIN
jgi:hypothetical protein